MDSTAFDFKRIAEGYKNRPFLHKQVIERFNSDLHLLLVQNNLFLLPIHRVRHKQAVACPDND